MKDEGGIEKYSKGSWSGRVRRERKRERERGREINKKLEGDRVGDIMRERGGVREIERRRKIATYRWRWRGKRDRRKYK